MGVFGDLGQMTVVAAGFAWQGEAGVTLARIIKAVSQAGIASSRRVRAICDNLNRLGIVTIAPDQPGRRDKPLLFGGWLKSALLSWLEVFARAVRPWLGYDSAIDDGSVVRHLTLHLDALGRHGLGPLQDWPEVIFFLQRLAGYPLLLDFLVSPPDSPGLSRKGLANVYGVSRRHIALLMAHGESQKWLVSDPLGRSLTLAQESRNRLRQWIAREFAFAVLALQ